MKPSHTKIGPFQLFVIETGTFKLDGGAMFGVVPKPLWQRHIQADPLNRIDMAARCLLVKSSQTGRIYLVDNGTGTKFDDKMKDIYQLNLEHHNLVDSLAQCGCSPEDITDMVFTHLHFDHCGGTTYYDSGGEIQHQFPNARYWVNRRHLQTVIHPNAREKASFLKDNIEPIEHSERLNTIEDYFQFENGFHTISVDGHTSGQQLPVIEYDGKKVIFTGDLIPTHVHIPVPWIMAYDMAPLQTLKEKELFLKQAAENNMYLFLEHDARYEVITVKNDRGRFSLKESLKLSDI